LAGLLELVILALLAKSSIGIFQKLLLPGGNLIGVYLVFDRQLLDGITFFERLKDDFGLKAVGQVSSFLSHSQQINILLFCCPIF